ncbi:MAG: hypothetical protein R6U96_15070 [Promethearchaeia archaeon]
MAATIIFGGISFIFFVAIMIIYQEEWSRRTLLLIISIILVILFILRNIFGLPFSALVIFILIWTIIIFRFVFQVKNEDKLAPLYY